MAPHPTQYYSFNVFTSDEKTVCPLLQTNFRQQNASKTIYSCSKPCPEDCLRILHFQSPAKMYILCQALSSECLEI